MSFDLFFYKRKNDTLTTADIRQYLSVNLQLPNERHADQWWYDNPDTEVYFSFEYEAPSQDAADHIDFDEFENTCFLFNMNFLRPDFFGKEAFPVVAKLMSDLHLFVFNPQFGAAADYPHQPSSDSLYKCWSDFNLLTSKDHFDQDNSYYPLEPCNESWWYNFNRKQLQEQLGAGYFVPRMFYFSTKKTGDAITVATWSEHIPTVIPRADYYVIWRETRRFFRKVTEKGFVSYDTLLNTFGKYFEPYAFDGCRIIHPSNAALAEKTFRSLKFEHGFDEFAERMSIANLYNSKPERE